MTLITFPTGINFESYTLRLMRKTIALQSPYSGKTQTLVMPFALWDFNGKFSQQVLINAGSLRSFLAQLEGMGNTFQFVPPEYSKPSTGYAGAAGLVNGASQTGLSLITNGWTASAAIFLAGDYFNINGEFKIVTANVTANISGQATIPFEPLLRASPANSLALTIVNPYVTLAANDDNTASWNLSPPIEYGMSLTATERF